MNQKHSDSGIPTIDSAYNHPALAARNPSAHKPALTLAYAAIFLGGMARLSQFDFDTLFGPDVVGSLAAELIGMPLLWAWTRRAA